MSWVLRDWTWGQWELRWDSIPCREPNTMSLSQMSVGVPLLRAQPDLWCLIYRYSPRVMLGEQRHSEARVGVDGWKPHDPGVKVAFRTKYRELGLLSLSPEAFQGHSNIKETLFP